MFFGDLFILDLFSFLLFFDRCCKRFFFIDFAFFCFGILGGSGLFGVVWGPSGAVRGRLGPARARLGPGSGLARARLGPARLGPARLLWAQVGWAPPGPDRLGPGRPGSGRLGSAGLGSGPGPARPRKASEFLEFLAGGGGYQNGRCIKCIKIKA